MNFIMRSALIMLFASIIFSVSSQDTLRHIENVPFKRGEVGKYRVFYDSWLTAGITAGVGTISILDENKKFYGRDTYHIEVLAKSVGMFSWFFKVRDIYESWVDTKSIAPWKFYRHQREGGYEIKETVNFNQFENTATSDKKKVEVPPYCQDVVSGFYYMRTLDFSDAVADKEYYINFIMG